MNIEANIEKYLSECGDGQQVFPTSREASFHYCFNYFQAFREAGHLGSLADTDNLEISCLQVGFFLASWGMFRGASFLLQRSVRLYERLVKVISGTDPRLWEIDAHCYTPPHVHMLLELKSRIVDAFGKENRPSDTLVTKVILGVFGSVPAFDITFTTGFKVSAFNERALERITAFYQANQHIIERHRIPIIDFRTGEPTHRKYSRAKVIDMAFFIEGGGK